MGGDRLGLERGNEGQQGSLHAVGIVLRGHEVGLRRQVGRVVKLIELIGEGQKVLSLRGRE